MLLEEFVYCVRIDSKTLMQIFFGILFWYLFLVSYKIQIINDIKILRKKI